MKIQEQEAVVTRDDYKTYEKGVRTPAAQVLFFSVGAWIVYLTAAFGFLRMPPVSGLRWSLVVFGLTLGAGLMLRMASPSIRSAIRDYAEKRAVADRDELEAQVSILAEQLQQAGVRGLAPSESVALQTAQAMIQAEFVRQHSGRGCGWSRDPFMKAHKGVRRKDWEYAREILEGAGIRDSETGAMLVVDLDRAKSVLLEYYTSRRRMFLNESGDWTKGG